MSLLLCVLGHLVQHSRHLSRSLIDINGIILLGLLIREHLHATSAIGLLLLFVLDHHVLVLLREHLAGRDIDGQLPLRFLLLLDCRNLLQLFLTLLVFFLRNQLHFFQFILLLLERLGGRLAISDHLRERVHVLQGGILGLEGVQAG